MRIAALLLALSTLLCSARVLASEERAGPAPPGPDVAEALSSHADTFFEHVNGALGKIIMYPVPIPFTTMPDPASPGRTKRGEVPASVLVLVLGALVCTVRLRLPQIRCFKHALDLVRGRFSGPEGSRQGEVTSFQALSAALSATVGLGNIGGVAVAIGTGGPGATLWMIAGGFLGMALKLTECTLGQMYRVRRADGRFMGGGMHYLSRGLGEIGLRRTGRVLAAVFCVLCIGASLGGGNTFQANQSMLAVAAVVPFVARNPWAYGLFMAVLVGLVILGGIRRIAAIASRIVPFMCFLYVLAALVVLTLHVREIPGALAAIVRGALQPRAALGGFLGVLVTGFKRAAFSNEAGVGSSPIAHSAARVAHPAQEGIVALLEPFVDTVVVCTMTALILLLTGAWQNEAYRPLIERDEGAALTSRALGEELPFMPAVLAVTVMLFAYSTMISWSYYGERCWAYLFGDRSSPIYRAIFVVFVFLGAITEARHILRFGDLLIFGMVLPNMVGIILLGGKVRRAHDDYRRRLASGEYGPRIRRGRAGRGPEPRSGGEA